MSAPRRVVEGRGPGSSFPLIGGHRPRRRLGRRLTGTALGAAGIALLVTGLILNIYLYASSRVALARDMQAQARIVADNSAAALLFDDRAAASDTLAGFQGSPVVLEADLLEASGVRFASYRASQTLVQVPDAEADTLVIRQPVAQNGQALGTLRIVVTLKPLMHRSALFALITGVAALAALGMAYLLAVGVRRDIDRTEARLDELAFIDPVTGLFNRHAANEHLQAMVARAQRSGEGFTLMLLDLDDFKLVNDTLGHAVGDDVLRLLAERLRSGLRASDIVFRFGGDEFVVVCDGPVREGASERVGQAAMECLRAPLQVGRHEIYVRGSVGIAQFPADADDAHELLRAADTAMYGAKAAGKNTFAAFDPEMGRSSHSQLRTATELRQALERDQLRLHYQPIVDLTNGRLIGVEALVRWAHPERGLLAPGEFIQVAESTGLVVELGAWVLTQAARQLAAWQGEGVHDFYVAVNVSGRQVRRGVLLAQVEAALAHSQADPRQLEIEITEHTLVENVNANVETLTALRDKGMRVAVDDFGTGLSSLAYLKRLPIDKFKIDRSFVHELLQGDDLAIVTAIISMARALGLRVVAEGVETEAQRAQLARLGCDFAQGYLFSVPVGAEAVTAMLREQGRCAA
jgi:diguanylate cyclase (GGDEF)-like protein